MCCVSWCWVGTRGGWGVTDHRVSDDVTNLRVKLSADARFEVVTVALRIGLLSLDGV